MIFFNKKKSKKVGNTNSQIKKEVFGPRSKESHPILGALVVIVALLTLVSLVDYNPKTNRWITTAVYSQAAYSHLVGKFGETLSFWLIRFMGLGAWGVPILLSRAAYLLFLKRDYLINKKKVFIVILSYISFLGILDILQYHWILKYSNYYNSGIGGRVGVFLYTQLTRESLGIVGSACIFGVLFMLGVMMEIITMERVKGLGEWVSNVITKIRKINLLKASGGKSILLEEKVEVEGDGYFEKLKTVIKKGKGLGDKSVASGVVGKEDAVAKNELKKGSKLKIIEGEKEERVKVKLPEKKDNYIYPLVSLLKEPVLVESTVSEDYQETAQILVKTLEEFSIKVYPGEVHTGPVITRYDVTPAAGIRVEKIANLDRNIAMGLRANSVRILAPVPGKGCVGIEVPNKNPMPVCLREIIESKSWAESKAEIPVVLGKDVTGKPLVADLTRMPHLLIAGSTGAGKTVCINAIIASLVYHSTPKDLRFIMVDPKIVEMQVYNDLPHMLIPVVTSPKKVPGALKWLIREMERRYQIFAQLGVRNIAGFNAKMVKGKEERESAERMAMELSPEERVAMNSIEVPRDMEVGIPKQKMPYIVCIIDELADLMMVAPADIETCIARLAQLARAAGIHLIIATQRPSVNVITGVIKANLPCRIAFKVASKVDSRTILDYGGADALIGRGDMLFTPPGSSDIIRAQGAFVSDDEINGIVEFLKRNGPPDYAEDVQHEVDTSCEDEDDFMKGGNGLGEGLGDDLIPAALEVLRSSQRASTSMLQRRLKIGYNRAARIMEMLEDEGVVGPENGAQPREILKDLEEVIASKRK